MDLKKLTEQMPFQWRAQQANAKGAQCVAYIDSRQVAERLDDVVGPENWQSDYRVVKDNLYAGIGIYDPAKKEWTWKWDCGTESNTEKEKGEASDAFKRAGVKWGIGRFLYDMELQKVKTTEYNGKFYPCDDRGYSLTGDKLTEFINARLKSGVKNTEPVEVPQAKKYEKPATEPTYTNPNTTNWSPAVTKKAGKVEKDGLKGSAALATYITKYNEANTEPDKVIYKTVSDFNTDELLNKLIKFVEEYVPTNLI